MVGYLGEERILSLYCYNYCNNFAAVFFKKDMVEGVGFEPT